MRIEPTSHQVNPAFIRDESVNQIQQQQQPNKQAEQSTGSEKSDKLSISQAANSINEAASELKSSEQFRADKVAQIKAQLESNSYDPGSRNVAEKMISQIGSFLKGVSA
ncbi:anti-sigma-28 factor, FlgM [Geobacter sp. OR-1]|uniref:flagellar biosynthesis anti-sigma factor FlgM n=1 Tax=Geobacter sp. OR-1 TaxID=1266765 RepID=UPI000543C62B|nr:flagellar biosynthesis anti-sigma factor FlgM [Geobacter sp. OR-1]GAM08426.1 anti-sigma-28 factor, FlgM [Geobacter sp. OR-1]